MEKEDIALCLLGAAAQKASEHIVGYSVNSGIQAMISANNASKIGALLIKGLAYIPPIDPLTATIAVGSGIVAAAIAYRNSHPSDYEDSPDDFYMPAMSGIYSG